MTERNYLIHYFSRLGKELPILSEAVHHEMGVNDVHDLRLCVRKLRAVLWLLKKSSPSIRFRKYENKLRDLGHVLAEVRELDVAIHGAKKFQIHRKLLKHKRKRARKHLRESTHKKTISRVGVLSAEVIDCLRGYDTISFNQAAEKLCSQINTLFKNGKINSKDLHKMRICFKSARYTLDALGRSGSPLKPIIEYLGDAHDLQVLQAMTHEHKDAKNKETSLNQLAIKIAGSALKYSLCELQHIR